MSDIFDDILCYTFRNTNYEDSQIKRIERLKANLEDYKWRTKYLITEINKLYNGLSQANRNIIKQEKKELEQLISKEKAQKNNLRSTLGSNYNVNSQDVKPFFLKHLVSEMNKSKRKSITQDLSDSLEKLENKLSLVNYDIQDLEDAKEYGGERDLFEEFRNLYIALRQKGWHRRDLSEFSTAIHSWDVGKLGKKLNQSKKEYTFLIFLPDIELEEKKEFADVVEFIAPPGSLEVDDLSELCPYGNPDFEYVPGRDDDFDYLASVPDLLDNTSLCMLKVEHFGHRGALEEALSKLEVFLDACSYSRSLSDFIEPHYKGKLNYIRWSEDDYDHLRPGSKTEEKIETRLFDRDKNSIDEVLEILDGNNDLVEPFKRGLSWFRSGNNSKNDVSAIIDYKVCFETIAASGSRSRKHVEDLISIGKLWATEENRELVKNIFQKRNDAIHRGFSERNMEKERKVMRHTVKESLYEVSNCIREEKAGNISDFVDYVYKKRQKDDRRKKLEFENSGLSLDRYYRFETDYLEFADDMEIKFKGRIKFDTSKRHLLPLLEVEEIEKRGNGRLGTAYRVEFSLKIDNLVATVELPTFSQWVAEAVEHDLFDYVSPWEGIISDFKIESHSGRFDYPNSEELLFLEN